MASVTRSSRVSMGMDIPVQPVAAEVRLSRAGVIPVLPALARAGAHGRAAVLASRNPGEKYVALGDSGRGHLGIAGRELRLDRMEHVGLDQCAGLRPQSIPPLP